MKVLVVGNGAREHTIAWKLAQSSTLSRLYVAPGNAGTLQTAENLAIKADDIDGLLRFALERGIDLTVVGPEAPLGAGIVDRFQEAGLLIFGPTQAAARIETSKSFAKELMLRVGVPTGRAETFDSYEQALGYVEQAPLPIVVKADGLAAGKGVVVAENRRVALDALRHQMLERTLGAAGERVLIEEFLEGRELSAFAFADGDRLSSLFVAQDYKRTREGEEGPNTGGMGSHSPPFETVWNEDVEESVRSRVMEPVVRALREEGSPFSGVLYAGLIVNGGDVRVIEFNCRLGDPEAQVVLPRLKTDLLEVMVASARGDLSGTSLDWDDRAWVGVVVASGGYPGSYSTGLPIDGLEAIDEDVLVFHAGTRASQDQGNGKRATLTDGGRVLTVTTSGDTLEAARRKAYANAGRISFHGAFYRRDIAAPARPGVHTA